MPKDAVTLSTLTTLQVGGPAEMFLRAGSQTELSQCLARAAERALPVLPLGGGSNVVVADRGVRACVVRYAAQQLTFADCGSDVLVTAEAGLPWDTFVQRVVANHLQGVECLSGIPGDVGATPIQNVGAYGQEVADTLESLDALELSSGSLRRFSAEECAFRYRDSYFKSEGAGRFLVTQVTFRLRSQGPPSVRYGELKQRLGAGQPTLDQVRAEVLRLRAEKSMLGAPDDDNRRSCGSFFVNLEVPEQALAAIAHAAGSSPPQFPGDGGLIKVPAAWLIERAGFQRGYRRGPVGLSTKHTLCLVAHDGARASDIVDLAWEIRRRVREKFNITLIPEPRFWGFDQLEDGLPLPLS